jgi:putative DNA primase/helicase
MLLGPPRCGKGTLLRVINKLIGVVNVSSPTMESLGETFGYMGLLRKSVAIVSDMSCADRKKLATAGNRINAVSGEDAVRGWRYCRPLHNVAQWKCQQ